jgi:hypothetical protein
MRQRTIRRLDRLTLAGIAAGLALVLQPWWAAGFRAGFFVAIAAVLGQIATSHLLWEEDA